MNIHQFLREKRLERKLSYREAAQLTGLSRVYISCIEYGTFIPEVDNLKKFAAGYGLNFEELYALVSPASLTSEADFDLHDILFIQQEDSVLYFHTADNCFQRTITLNEYLSFEENIEDFGFLRSDAGVFVNLSHIKALSKPELEIYFKADFTGKHASISFLTERHMGPLIQTVIRNNNQLSNEIHMKTKSSLYSILRLLSPKST